jgi:polysaccharide export outer membrane protein
LAKQYGIELPGSNVDSGSGESSLGDIGQQLEQLGLNEEEYIEDELEEVADEGVAAQLFERYGVSLFEREVSTFAPTDDALVP